MKNIILLPVIFVYSLLGYTQELVVTKSGDSIYCSELKKTPEHLYIQYMHEGKERHTLLPLSEVVSYTKDKTNQTSVSGKVQLPVSKPYKWHMGLSTGYSKYLPTGQEYSNSTQADFADKIRSGLNVDGNLIYYGNKDIGFGVKTNLFNSSNSHSYEELTQTTLPTGDLHERVRVLFIGMQLSFRGYDKAHNNILRCDISGGNMSINDRAHIPGSIVTLRKNGFAFGVDLAYDIKIQKDVYAGVQTNFLSGSFKRNTANKYTHSGRSDNSSRLGLHRIDISAGLRFHF